MEFKVGDKVLINPKMKRGGFMYGFDYDMDSLYTKPGVIIGLDSDGSIRVQDATYGKCWYLTARELTPAIVLNKNKLGNFPRKTQEVK